MRKLILYLHLYTALVAGIFVVIGLLVLYHGINALDHR